MFVFILARLIDGVVDVVAAAGRSDTTDACRIADSAACVCIDSDRLNPRLQRVLLGRGGRRQERVERVVRVTVELGQVLI